MTGTDKFWGIGWRESLYSVVGGRWGRGGEGGKRRIWRKKRRVEGGRCYRPKQVWQFWKLSWGKKGFCGLVAMLNWAWPSDWTQPSLSLPRSLSCLNCPRTGKPSADSVWTGGFKLTNSYSPPICLSSAFICSFFSGYCCQLKKYCTL